MPNDPSVSDTQFYRVSATDTVVLRVEIGDEQVGGTSVTLKGEVQQITSGALTLGTGAELLTNLVHCITTVKDVNPQTNRSDVTYFLSGGTDGEQRFPYSVEVQSNGGFAQYFIDFAFI